MHHKRPEQNPASDFIVKLWLELGRPPVDAKFLETVQRDLTQRLGNDAMSPAAVARLLADEGAELRHPEIIEFDVRWRESLVKGRADKFGEVARLSSGARLSIDEAGKLISKLEKLRQEFERDHDNTELDQLRTLAAEARQRAEAMGKNRKLDETVRSEQAEVAEWLKVWLQTPALFENWSELRRRSDEFQSKFPGNS